MQKIISFLVVATIAIPFTFAASGDSTPALTPTPKVTTMNAPSETVAASGVTSQSTGVSLGESKSVSCSSNPAFGTNSCDQCFECGKIAVILYGDQHNLDQVNHNIYLEPDKK